MSSIELPPQTPKGMESKENGPQLMARVTFSRHEETNYTGIGRDITDQGIARAQEKGKVTTREKGAPRIIGHSPRERAKGTAESIEEGSVKETGGASEARWLRIPGLRSTDYRDKAFLAELTKELGTTQEAWTHAHYHKPTYYDNPDKVETNEEKRARMYRELERLVSFLEKKDLQGEAPHLVFVSHYELITLLLDDVFGIDTFGTPNTPSFGEHVDIDLYRPLISGDVPIRIHYNGREKNVLFDRKLRRLVASPI